MKKIGLADLAIQKIQLRALESMTEGVNVATEDGVIIYTNPAENLMFGYEAGELVGKSVTVLNSYSDDENERRVQEVIEELRSKGSWVGTWSNRKKDGSVFSTYARISAVDVDGNKYWVCVHEDVTDRQRRENLNQFIAKAAVVLSSSLDFRKTLSNVAEIAVPEISDWCSVYILNSQGHIDHLSVAHRDPDRVKWAQSYAQNFPIDLQSPIGIGAVLRTGQAEMISRVSEEAVKASARSAEQLEIMKQVGYRSFMAVPIRLRGQVMGGISFVMTESLRYFTNEDLKWAQELADRAAYAIENARLYAHSETINRIKDEFLATLSHELRTPLNVILGQSEILLGSSLSGEERESVEAIHRQARIQTQIISDLLDVSSILKGKLNFNPSLVSPLEVLFSLVESMRPVAESRGLRFETDFAPLKAKIHVDPVRLHQILLNLISNAFKFTPAGGTVTLRVKEESDYCAFYVEDTGVGIHPDFLPHLFERFRQEDSSITRKHGGLGLGLSIVRHLTEFQKGKVSVFSAGKDMGSTFSVRFPVATDVQETRKMETLDFASAPNLKATKILLIEDQEDNRVLVSKFLRNAGATVVEAESAAIGRALLSTFQPDLLISDLGLPEEDGISFIKSVRAENISIPAIALTAYVRDEEKAEALTAGFQVHLSKPISRKVLLQTVSELVPRNY